MFFFFFMYHRGWLLVVRAHSSMKGEVWYKLAYIRKYEPDGVIGVM